MRLIKLFTICTALITTVLTVAAAEPVKDTASVQKTAAVSNHTISMQILGLEYGYSFRLVSMSLTTISPLDIVPP